jgi:hypothetical protein
MADTDKLKMLQRRRQEILERLEICQREIARCHEDLRSVDEDENAIFLSESEADVPIVPARRIEKVSAVSNHSKTNGRKPSPNIAASSIDAKSPNRNEGMPHPKGAPSITDMVWQILRETRTSHPEGLAGRELVKMINDRWWPGVSQNSILPKLYKRKQLFVRKYGRWTLKT